MNDINFEDLFDNLDDYEYPYCWLNQQISN